MRVLLAAVWGVTFLAAPAHAALNEVSVSPGLVTLGPGQATAVTVRAELSDPDAEYATLSLVDPQGVPGPSAIVKDFDNNGVYEATFSLTGPGVSVSGTPGPRSCG